MSQASRRFAFGSLSIALFSCGAPAGEPASSAQAPSSAVASPAEPAVAETAPAPAPIRADDQASVDASATAGTRLLVGGDEGLREVDLDGKMVSQWTKTPALRPRKLDDGSVLFLEETEGTLSLKRYSPSGAVKEVAKIPTGFDGGGCKLSPSAEAEVSLGVHSDESFVVNRAKGQACLTIADRNANMADVSFVFRVDIESGRVDSSLELDNITECAQGSALVCGGTLAAGPEPGAIARSKWAWDWSAESLSLFPRGAPKHETAKHLCGADVDISDDDSRSAGCASEEGRSGSGRFVLVSGPTSEGDYIHRELFLIDLQSGEVLGLMGDTPALKPVTAEDVVTDGFGSMGAVGESDVRWLDGDRLWIDGVLVNPVARKSTQVDGQLAW